MAERASKRKKTNSKVAQTISKSKNQSFHLPSFFINSMLSVSWLAQTWIWHRTIADITVCKVSQSRSSDNVLAEKGFWRRVCIKAQCSLLTSRQTFCDLTRTGIVRAIYGVCSCWGGTKERPTCCSPTTNWRLPSIYICWWQWLPLEYLPAARWHPGTWAWNMTERPEVVARPGQYCNMKTMSWENIDICLRPQALQQYI